MGLVCLGKFGMGLVCLGDPYQNLPRQTRPISKLTKTDQTHIKTYQDRPDPYQNLPRQTRPISKLTKTDLVSFDMGLVFLGKF
jgi:hypothetical protein